jgi:chromosome segregation ATPase
MQLIINFFIYQLLQSQRMGSIRLQQRAAPGLPDDIQSYVQAEALKSLKSQVLEAQKSQEDSQRELQYLRNELLTSQVQSSRPFTSSNFTHPAANAFGLGDSLFNTCQNLQQQIESKNKQISDLLAQSSTFQSTIQRLRQDLAAKTESESKLNMLLEQLNSEFRLAENRAMLEAQKVSSLQNDLRTLQQETDNQRQTISQLQESHDELQLINDEQKV